MKGLYFVVVLGMRGNFEGALNVRLEAVKDRAIRVRAAKYQMRLGNVALAPTATLWPSTEMKASPAGRHGEAIRPSTIADKYSGHQHR